MSEGKFLPKLVTRMLKVKNKKSAYAGV